MTNDTEYRIGYGLYKKWFIVDSIMVMIFALIYAYLRFFTNYPYIKEILLSLLTTICWALCLLHGMYINKIKMKEK